MCCQDVFEIRYARMPEDRPVPMDTGGSVSANTGLTGTCDQSSAASDSGSETGPVTESLRERRLRELQLQVSVLYTVDSLCLLHTLLQSNLYDATETRRYDLFCLRVDLLVID